MQLWTPYIYIRLYSNYVVYIYMYMERNYTNIAHIQSYSNSKICLLHCQSPAVYGVIVTLQHA